MSRTDLSKAIRVSNLEEVKSILNSDPSLLEELVESQDSVRYSPFVEAVILKKLDIVNFLVSKGAEIHRRFDAPEEKGFTVAHWAAINGNATVLKRLVDLGVDFDVRTNRNTSPLSKSAGLDNCTALRFFLEELHLDPHTKAFQGDSLLHIAAFAGKVAPFRYLRNMHNLDLYEENEYKLTPVFKAAAGSVALLEMLESQGVNYREMVNTRHNTYNYACWTPLHYSCERGNLSTFDYLVNTLHLDVEARTLHKSNCLLIAAGSSLELVQKLLTEHHQDPHVVNDFGENAVFIACKHGKVDVVRYLWRTVGINITIRNKEGVSPLEIARGKIWEKDVRTIVETVQKKAWNMRKGLLAVRFKVSRLHLV